MTPQDIITRLETNLEVITNLVETQDEQARTWKQNDSKWSLIEILRHLIDEEREDFRTRTRLALEDPEGVVQSIDPVGWVTSRDYKNQDYEQSLAEWQNERRESISWLKSLKDPQWDNEITLKVIGPMSAKKFLANWLAHDQLHIKQITRLQYDYLAHSTSLDISYAGTWK